MRVLANVVSVCDVNDQTITYVASSSYTSISSSFDVTELEREALAAYFARCYLLTFKASRTAIVITVSVRVFTSVTTVTYIEIHAADIAASNWISVIIRTHSRIVSLL